MDQLFCSYKSRRSHSLRAKSYTHLCVGGNPAHLIITNWEEARATRCKFAFFFFFEKKAESQRRAHLIDKNPLERFTCVHTISQHKNSSRARVALIGRHYFRPYLWVARARARDLHRVVRSSCDCVSSCCYCSQLFFFFRPCRNVKMFWYCATSFPVCVCVRARTLINGACRCV